MTDAEQLPDASPPTWARIAAVASIIIAGVAGGLIGWSIMDLQCEESCDASAALVGVASALICAFGVAVVAVLTLRAMAEWKAIEARSSSSRPGASVTPKGTHPSDLRALAAGVAGDVGREVIDRRARGLSWNTKSSVTDIVTEVDTWAESEVVERIADVRPDDGFLGEEGTDRTGLTGITWIIDPIDGTTNLLHDLPGYSVSIAASDEGQVVAGAVYDPIRAELFTAGLGEGATRNGSPIEASNTDELARALVGTGFSYRTEDRREQARQLSIILPLIRDVRRLGGAAVDLCNVACGRLDAFFERGLSPWDSAAGGLIAREAGAVVREGELTYAVGAGVADDFIALLREVGA